MARVSGLGEGFLAKTKACFRTSSSAWSRDDIGGRVDRSKRSLNMAWENSRKLCKPETCLEEAMKTRKKCGIA